MIHPPSLSFKGGQGFIKPLSCPSKGGTSENRQTVYDAKRLMGQVQKLQKHATNLIESLPQVAPPAIETTLRRNVREQITVFLPKGQHSSLRVQASRLADQCHGDQFTIATQRGWPWMLVEGRNLLLDVIHNDKNPGAKIFKIGYHGGVLQSRVGMSTLTLLRRTRFSTRCSLLLWN